MPGAPRWSFILMALVFWTAIARGGGPQPEHIAADAKAYMHFDTSLLRASALLAQFRKENGPANPLDKTLDTINTFLGFHPLEDLDGITFYTTTLAQGEGVLLMYGKIDDDAVLKRLETFPEHAAQPYGDHQIHTWFDNDRKATVAGAIVSDKLMMWADTLDRLKTALDVIDGKKDGKFGLAQDFPKGAMFAAGLRDVPAFAVKPDQWVLRLAQSFELALFENQGTLKVTITALMADAEQAAEVRQVAEGLKAFAALNKEKIPEVAPLVAQVKTATEGIRTTASLELPAESAFDDLKKIQKAASGKTSGNTEKSGKQDPGQP